MTRQELLAQLRKYLGKHYYYPKAKDGVDNLHDVQGMSYDDIFLVVQYWYDVKKSDPAKSGGGVGIVSYIKDEALTYWKKEREYQEMIENITDYEPPQIETISVKRPPVTKPKTIKLFELK